LLFLIFKFIITGIVVTETKEFIRVKVKLNNIKFSFTNLQMWLR